jgi:dipeptidyl aminopeptidase/acylaminoacyl peptidase
VRHAVDAPLQFIENSPIFWVERIRTPYLTIHNDGDTAVPGTRASSSDVRSVES